MATATVETAQFVAEKLAEATQALQAANAAVHAAMTAIEITETEPELKNASLQAIAGAITVANMAAYPRVDEWAGYARARATR